jgi:cell division protein FtsQ
MIKRAKRPASAPPPRRRRSLFPRLRGAVPAILVALLVGAGYAGFIMSRSPDGMALLASAGDRVLAMSAAFGLVVNEINVEGRETTDAATILTALSADRGTPILAVSPDRAKQQLETLPWVRSATIERRLPGTLIVRLSERRPLAVWQHDGKLELIDKQGEVIPVKNLSRFAKLPTVVGERAAVHAAALLDLLGHEPELAARVSAAVRVDNRRWNVRIDNTIDVLLPEEDLQGAWARLAVLERQNNLLKRDVQTVDLRLPDRLVLRTIAPSPKEAAPAKPRPPGKNT